MYIQNGFAGLMLRAFSYDSASHRPAIIIGLIYVFHFEPCTETVGLPAIICMFHIMRFIVLFY